jgi:hypothetical protein
MSPPVPVEPYNINADIDWQVWIYLVKLGQFFIFIVSIVQSVIITLNLLEIKYMSRA